jgi:LAO/AO transport system kinase
MLAAYADGILGWNRAILARAITLIESNRPDHQEMAEELLNRLLPHTGRARSGSASPGCLAPARAL